MTEKRGPGATTDVLVPLVPPAPQGSRLVLAEMETSVHGASLAMAAQGSEAHPGTQGEVAPRGHLALRGSRALRGHLGGTEWGSKGSRAHLATRGPQG